jgi:hypothetical protein
MAVSQQSEQIASILQLIGIEGKGQFANPKRCRGGNRDP